MLDVVLCARMCDFVLVSLTRGAGLLLRFTTSSTSLFTRPPRHLNRGWLTSGGYAWSSIMSGAPPGEVAERLNAAVLLKKIPPRRKEARRRRFESSPLRHSFPVEVVLDLLYCLEGKLSETCDVGAGHFSGFLEFS